jgi:Extracellular link domain
MEANTTSTVDPVGMYNYLTNIFTNPTALIILIVIVFIYIIFFVSLGGSSSSSSQSNMFGSSASQSSPFSFGSQTESSSSGTSKILIGVVIFIIVIIIIFNVFKYFFGVDITVSANNLFTSAEKELDINVNTQTSDQSNNGTNTKTIYIDEQTIPSSSGGQSVPEIMSHAQVFNIPGNYYNYNEANTLCQAYGARLANYNEIENAYVKGAEWCNYGWSSNQLALFPTQKKTYNNLQNIAGHENDCGRPGINGGYIANPNVKFGVNCFGHKPKINSTEEEMMKNTTPYPKTEQDILMEKEVDFWKSKLDEIIVSPFNYNSWSNV